MKQIAFLIAASVIAGFGMIGQATAQDARVPTISVDGSGSVDAAPDMATVTLGVRAEAEEAQAALTATSGAAEKVLEALSGLGIESRDIQTQSITLNPVWSNRQSSDDAPPRITGYEASNEAEPSVRSGRS